MWFNKDILIQPSEVQKPGTGQKTGPQTTGKIIRVNEPAWQKKFSYIKFFSTGTKTGNQTPDQLEIFMDEPV